MARFNFTVRDAAALERLRKRTGRTTKADVINDALALYARLSDDTHAGKRLYVGDSRETAVELAVTAFEIGRKR